MTAEDADERVAVRTYVAAHQRDRWDAEADNRGMSRAEYVRTMVQGGRRSFELDERALPSVDTVERPANTSVDPGGEGLETRVLEVLDEDERTSWGELVAILTAPFQEQLEELLERLEDEERIDHTQRLGGYAVIDDGD